MAKTEGRGIQSIEVGGRLLSLFATASGPMMLKDLAAGAALAPAQAHAYLASYRRVELVEQDPATGMYSLGPAAVRLGIARLRSTQPLASASVEAVRLSEMLGFMVALVVWGPHAPTAVQVQEGAESLNINLRAGATFSVIESAGGRIFAAFGDLPAVGTRIDQEFARLANRVAGQAMFRDDFDSKLVDIRKKGFASVPHSPVPGLSSVAAPVFGPSGGLELAIAFVGKAPGLKLSASGEPVRALVRVAQNLSKLGTTN